MSETEKETTRKMVEETETHEVEQPADDSETGARHDDGGDSTTDDAAE